MSPTFATRTDLQSSYRLTAIVCAALIAGLFLYPLIVELMHAQGRLPSRLPAQTLDPLRFGCYTLALTALAAGAVLRRVLATLPAGPDMHTLLRRLQTAVLSACALAEVPAALGFALFLLAGLRGDFYLLWLFSLAAMLVHFPRRALWEDRARMARRPA